MSNTIIIILLLGLVFFNLSHITNRIKKDAYQWWLQPWIALAYSGLMYLLYYTFEIPDWSFVRILFEEEYQIEAIYSVLCIAIWMGLHFFLRDATIHEACIGTFRNLFANSRDDKERVLPFPYFIDEDGVVRAKVGQVFYRWTMKSFILIIALIYAIFFILLRFDVLQEFYLKSAFGILGLLPLMEYFIYLCAEVPLEKEIAIDDKKYLSNFDELWELYVNTFNNYSVAWKKTLSPKELEQTRGWKKDNDDDFDNLMKQFMDEELHSNAIIENIDIATAFIKLEPIFDYVEKNGRHVLIAFDIPNHFTKNQRRAFIDDIAAKLTEILRKNFCVYCDGSAQSKLNNSIVIASLSLLSRQGIMDEEWMKKIGLITVVNVFDKGVSNMFECRKFCYILQSVNTYYQVVFITPYRIGMEPCIKNTWLTNPNWEEKKMRQFPKGKYQYFIGYDFEGFKERFNKILTAIPSEPLYSGSEMAPIALSSRIGEKEKVVTPIHYLDLAYSNVIEGKEELNKFYELITKECPVSKRNILDNFNNHLLPVDQINEEQVLSVIYDIDNNVPAIYSKWVHLGFEKNFSIVISKPYLFRDYFNMNHDYFVMAPFAALQPHLCKSRLTLAIILLNMLQKAEMEERNLRDLLNYYYNESEIISLSGVIKDLFNTYFSSDLASMLMTNDEIVFKNGKYHHLLKYNLSQLTDANTPSYLDVIAVKDESGNVLLDILYDLIYQNFDKGQIHSFSGKPYEIKDFNQSTKTLNVSSINDGNVLFYKPKQCVSIRGNKTPIKELNSSPIKWPHPITNDYVYIHFQGYETIVDVDTVEWYEFNKYTVNGYSSKKSKSPKRVYQHGKVLKISFGFIQKQEYRERIHDIRKSLQILLYEAMQSVFPHHAQYLIISSIGDGDSDLPWIFNTFECKDEINEKELSFYFIEDAHVDLGLIGALAIDPKNIRYILQYIYDYLIWLTEGWESPASEDDSQGDVSNWTPTDYDEYLIRENIDKFVFLKYGREKLPTYFDVKLMVNFIKDLFQDQAELQKTIIDRQSKHSLFGSCDFCGTKMKNSDMTRLNDGRMRCPKCSEDAIDNDEQFKQACNKVKEAFLTHLDIDFSDITHNAKLVSAVELHNLGGYLYSVTNGYDIRKILGLAFDKNVDEFYVENGYKFAKTFGIVAHEMTHIWEFNDPDFKKVRKTNEDLVEGLAVWTDLFLSEKNGSTDIENHRESWLARDDEYGRGLKFIMQHCPDDPYGYIREKAKQL